MALTQVSTGGVKDGTILNADLNAAASIAGTKVSPSFGSQNISTTGTTSIGGATSVGTKLHIENSSGDAHIRLRGSANYGILFTRHSDGALTGYVGSGNAVNLGGSDIALSASLSGGSIKFQTNGTAATDEKMRIQNDGKIGVNTTAPSELFTINGADQSALIRTSNAVGTAKLKFEADGTNYAGIGLENTSLVFRCSNSSTPTSRMTIAANGAVTISGSISNAAMTHITDGGSATTLGTAATCRISNNGGNGAYSVFEAESNVGSIRLANDGQFYVTGASTFSNDIRVDRGSAIDGLLGQAYSGYFGLKHADQTMNSEYMILNADGDTFISCSAGTSVRIRPNANNTAHELLVTSDVTLAKAAFGAGAINIDPDSYGDYAGGFGNILDGGSWGARGMWVHGGGTGDAAAIAHNGSNLYFGLQNGSAANSMATYMMIEPTGDICMYKNVKLTATVLRRSQHHTGHLEGGYNNIGANSDKSNPIFTIGSAYNPNAETLSNMYGIGYSHGNASFTPSGPGWGMYVAADGDARIFLDGSYGNIYLNATGSQGAVIFANGGWSGESSTGKIQTHGTNMYLQHAGGSWIFRKTNGVTAAQITSAGVYGTSDLTLKKDVVTITNSVDIIKKLVGRSFTWKEDNIKSFGVIAQEVETVLPELVSTSDEPEGSEIEPKKNVNYSAFTGHFIEAIKELATKIEALETEVAALKAS